MIELGLAAWRYAYFVTNDSLPEPLKYKFLDVVASKAPAVVSEKIEELVGNEEQSGCIYCMTFWTSLLLVVVMKFSKSNWFIRLGAVWAVATLIGVTHNVVTDVVSDKENVE